MKLRNSLLMMILLLSAYGSAFAQGTAFTYQGKLADNGAPASGNYDFEFKLFDTATVGTGSQKGATVQRLNVAVASGAFTVSLDFGACASCFTGADRFLEISVKQNGGSTFTTLSPRQPISSTPYALKSLNAGAADGLSVLCVSCITSSQIGSVSGSAVTGSIPVTSVPSGSGNYVQNTTSQQTATNFNISGNGTVGGTLSANAINAGMQFNLNGSRVLSAAGGENLIAGIGAGTANLGSFNTFVGASAGASTRMGFGNSFFGARAGELNDSGIINAFFGVETGISNTGGSSNAFFGTSAGHSNTSGDNNTFAGNNAGDTNTTGTNNTIIGFAADVGTNNLVNATALGSRSSVTQNNSLILGSINGVNGATADTNVGIGTNAPLSRLDVVNTTDTQIRFGNTSSDQGGYLVSSNSSQATLSGGARFDGTNWIAKSTSASRIENLAGTTRFFTDTGLSVGNSFTPTERMRITATGNVGVGTTAPADKLEVNGIIRVATLGGAGSTTLCRNASNQIATCSSSLRYKTDIQPFVSGLDVVNRLRPISFTWKQSGIRDIGFGAEEVARVAPMFTFTNDKGEIEGVKYDRIGIVLVNAIKEQQAQITEQQQTISELKRIVCLDHPNADLCRAKKN